ncbi:MAG: FAD-binding oxidoreductase [Rhizobacter sp.]
MPTARTTSGKQFDVTDGEALLDAALRAHVTLAYSCRTGRCSSCKGKVKSGSTTALHDELGLTAEERAAGWVLTCVRTATSDVELEVEDLGNVELATARTLPCRIQTLEKVTPDVLKVTLRLPPNSRFAFQAGQYIDVIGPGGVRRSYSIANAPATQDHLELHIRHFDGGEMSRYWFEQAKANDLLRLHGPLGTFFLREIEGVHLVFLATGTGIAPVKAMLERLAQQDQRPASVTVYWGNRVEADLYWDATSPPAGQRYVPVLSRAGADWAGARGHVQNVMLQTPHDWPHTRVYACGYDAMIHSARDALVAAGLDGHHFHSDAFVCSASAP